MWLAQGGRERRGKTPCALSFPPFRRVRCARCCCPTGAATVLINESTHTNPLIAALSVAPSAGRPISRPTSRRTACITRAKLASGLCSMWGMRAVMRAERARVMWARGGGGERGNEHHSLPLYSFALFPRLKVAYINLDKSSTPVGLTI